MMLTYNGAVSTFKLLPSGCPQGAYLGGLIFIIKFNAAFLRPPIPRPPTSLNDPKSIQVKYIDDGSVAVRVNLKECLALDPVTRPKPLSYHERSGHILPSHNNLLQMYIQDAELFASENLMKINKEKTKNYEIHKL